MTRRHALRHAHRPALRLPAAAGLLIGAAWLAGCTTPPVAEAQLPAPAASFTQAPAGVTVAEPAERFWRAFGDPDLDALVGEALQANSDIRIAVARLREARALERLAGADDLPTVGTPALAARVRQPDGSGGSTTGSVYGAGLGVRWEIDLFGRIADEKAAAGADAAASAALVQAARLAVAGDVARNYFELRGLQERLRVAQESLLTQREALKVVTGRLEAGRGTAFDTERARALMLGTEATVPALELLLVQTGQRLSVLLGRTPQAVDARLVAVKPLPGLQAVPLGDIGTPEKLLERRPDLQAAARQAEAAAARVGVAYKSRLPSLTLGGTLGLSSGRLADLNAGSSFIYNLGASLAWTLFDNGANEALTDAALARQLAAVISYEKSVLLALEETEGAFAAYTRTQQQAQSLFGAAQAADKAAQIARGRFGAGASDFLAVLDAERELLAARDRLAGAQTAAAVSVVLVYKALGGGVGEVGP
jgi:multidrug efflux system outer membrane protein